MEKRTYTYIALALLVWAISGTIVASYYFTQYNTYQNEYETLTNEFNILSGTLEGLSNTLSGKIGDISDIMESISLKANVFIKYDNMTKVWHNNTALPLGSTAFTAILAMAEIKYIDYGGDLGILVTSINGLASNSTHGWLYWYWDAEKSEWILPEYSCAKYILHRGDIIAFTYESYMSWPPPQPT